MRFNILPSKVLPRSRVSRIVGVVRDGGVGIGALLLCIATVGHGQGQPGPQAASGHESPQSSSVISAAFPRPLSTPEDARYKIVHYCAVQAARITDSVKWDKRVDTIPWRATDTLPMVVKNRARQCMARFNIAQVGRLFFETAAKVTLVANNDSILMPIIDSLLIMQQEAHEAGNKGFPRAAEDFFRALLSAAPVRVNLAQKMIERSRVLNSSAYHAGGEAKERAQQYLVNLYDILYRYGKDIADVSLMEECRDSIQVMFSALQEQDSTNLIRKMSNEIRMLRMDRELYGMRFGSDSILAVASRQKALYGTLFPEDPERAAREIGGIVLLGKQAPPANAPFTFFRNGITQIPEPGRAMVVLRVGERCDMDCGAEIMRFKSMIGDVPIVLLAQVFGNVRQSNPGTPAQNAEALRAHLQDSLGVKLSLIVDTAPQYVIPAPDLRHLYGQSRLLLDWADAGKSTTFIAARNRTDVGGMVVINKHGRVVWETNFFNGQQDNKEFITQVIKKIASE